MAKDRYHHGDLKKAIISQGLKLLNKEGYEGFSLRKVAVLCGVSHAAPYKHFKDKDELIAAITQEVAESFRVSLEEVLRRFPDDPNTQIVEMGKAYVRYMVENPDYLKFMFQSNFHYDKGIEATREGFGSDERSPAFLAFRWSASFFLSSKGVPENEWMVEILTMWSVVHGFAALIVNRSITYDGDYLALIETMLRQAFRIPAGK